MAQPAHQPPGRSTVSVYMMATGAQRVIDFATAVLGGEVILRHDRPDGSLMHGEVKIGDSVIMVADASVDYPGFPVWLHVYVPDVDAAYRSALDHGATSVQEPSAKGDGDRRSGVKDAAGNTWWLATPVPA